ncbi:MAG: translation initiation factor [Candidatus Omnitrophota bacterium]
MIFIPDSIYPKDAQGNPICPRCKKLINSCACPSYEPPKSKQPKLIPRIRLDKSGRKGKAVTLIKGLPPSEVYLKNLAKDLKVKTGSGGTFYVEQNFGVIEIQGDHCSIIKRVLMAKEE